MTAPVDAKAGWSTMCRRGDTRLCETAGAECTNPAHGTLNRPHTCGPCRRGNHGSCAGLRCTCTHEIVPPPAVEPTPEPAAGPIMPPPPAKVADPEPPPPEDPPSEEPAMPEPSRTDAIAASQDQQRQVLELLRDGGPITGDNCAAVLAEALRIDSNLLRNRLAKLDTDGLIEREIRGKRTVSIAITAAGRGFVDAGEAPPARPAKKRAAGSSTPAKRRQPARDTTPDAPVAPVGPLVTLEVGPMTGDELWAVLHGDGDHTSGVIADSDGRFRLRYPDIAVVDAERLLAGFGNAVLLGDDDA